MKKQKRALHPDIYDALEFSALAFGGIGAGNWFVYDAPYCARGHAAAITGDDNTDYNIVIGALDAIGVSIGANDTAVPAVNQRLNRPDVCARITFKQWAKELGIVRAVLHEGSEVVSLSQTFGLTDAT